MSGKKQEGTFRKKFRGYSVDDVNAYIGKISDEYRITKEELQSAVMKLTDENASLKKEIEELKKQLENATSEDISSEKEEYIRKAEEYDKLSSSIGEILISVTNRSDALIEDSRQRAQRVVSASIDSSNRSAERARKNLADGIKDFSDGYRMSVSELTENYLKEFTKTIDTVSQESKAESRALDGIKEDISSDIKSKAEKIKRDFEKKIDEIKKQFS